MYKQGYLRTSSGAFSVNDQNNFVHLTNHCFQVHGADYAKHEDGNTLSYADFQKYLDKTYPKLGVKLEDFFYPRIKDVIIDVFLSAKRKFNPLNRPNVFELFGFDFLIDEDFRVWLLEVNTNPYLGTPNEYMRQLVPRMINDTLKIVVDPVLPPKTVPEPLRKNDFELVYREATGKPGNAVLNLRRSFAVNTIYPEPVTAKRGSLAKKRYASMPKTSQPKEREKSKCETSAAPIPVAVPVETTPALERVFSNDLLLIGKT